jgi:hypothetical protein
VLNSSDSASNSPFSINGSSTINTNFGSATFVTNGGDWYRI